MRMLSNHGDICSMADACDVKDEDDAFGYFVNNFNRHYYGNRAPFALNMHATWFDEKSFVFKALNKFVKDLLKKPDVWIVNVEQLINWMEQPTKQNKMKYFKRWRRNRGCYNKF